MALLNSAARRRAVHDWNSGRTKPTPGPGYEGPGSVRRAGEEVRGGGEEAEDRARRGESRPPAAWPHVPPRPAQWLPLCKPVVPPGRRWEWSRDRHRRSRNGRVLRAPARHARDRRRGPPRGRTKRRRSTRWWPPPRWRLRSGGFRADASLHESGDRRHGRQPERGRARFGPRHAMLRGQSAPQQ